MLSMRSSVHIYRKGTKVWTHSVQLGGLATPHTTKNKDEASYKSTPNEHPTNKLKSSPPHSSPLLLQQTCGVFSLILSLGPYSSGLFSFFLQHHPAFCTLLACLSESYLSPHCGTSVICAHSDLPAIQGNSLMPLPVIHTAIHSLPLSDNLLRLLASSSGNTHNLLQISLASVSLATSVILALSGSNFGPLSTPHSLAATFAASNLRSPGSSCTLGTKDCPLGSSLTLVGLLLPVVHFLAITPALALHILAICTTPLRTPSAAAASASGPCRRLAGSGSHCCHQM